MNTMGDYNNLYLKTDVLLLADVFGNFINTCLEYYGLGPCHYFSSPGLNWDAMFKKTGIELKLISDIEMHLLIERGIRGGISYIAKRYSKANNKYRRDYDSNEGSKYIFLLDASNSFDWAISQYLPYSGFKWVTQKEIDRFDVNFISEQNPIGYKLEVDLEYLDKLHNLHDDYPLAPENSKLVMICCQNIVVTLRKNIE